MVKRLVYESKTKILITNAYESFCYDTAFDRKIKNIWKEISNTLDTELWNKIIVYRR